MKDEKVKECKLDLELKLSQQHLMHNQSLLNPKTNNATPQTASSKTKGRILNPSLESPKRNQVDVSRNTDRYLLTENQALSIIKIEDLNSSRLSEQSLSV
jgi:hypothetical protein